MAGYRYSIKKNRFLKGYYEGFRIDNEGTLTVDEKSTTHSFFLRGIDFGVDDVMWGRFWFQTDLPEESVSYIYVYASNRDELSELMSDPMTSCQEKIRILVNAGAKRFVSQNDMLLYELTGRYLYIGYDLIAEKGTISRIRVDTPGDNFMGVFPEIYHQRNSDFHRLMSVFSSIFNDYQEEFDDLPKILDVDTCPSYLLPLYGRSLGIDLDGSFMEERIMRKLVKEVYSLNKMKGTKRVIERIIEIVLECKVVVLEHNLVKAYFQADESMELPESMKNGGIYDVTVLISKEITEAEKNRLLFILNQFKPIRTNISILQTDKTATTDSNSYLDVDAYLPDARPMILDEKVSMNDFIVLE